MKHAAPIAITPTPIRRLFDPERGSAIVCSLTSIVWLGSDKINMAVVDGAAAGHPYPLLLTSPLTEYTQSQLSSVRSHSTHKRDLPTPAATHTTFLSTYRYARKHTHTSIDILSPSALIHRLECMEVSPVSLKKDNQQHK